MPYASIEDLPLNLTQVLPVHAQQIYRAAFNAAWHNYAAYGPQQREETAHRVAWAAVKRKYREDGEQWIAR